MRITGSVNQLIARFTHLLTQQENILSEQREILNQITTSLQQQRSSADEESTTSSHPSLPSLVSRETTGESRPRPIVSERPGRAVVFAEDNPSRTLVVDLEAAEGVIEEAERNTRELEEARTRVQNDRLSTSSDESLYQDPQVQAAPVQAAPPIQGPPVLSVIRSPRNLSVGDRVWITNQISHSTGRSRAAVEADRSATVTRINIFNSRIFFETDSGTRTYRKVKNLKKIEESTTI